MALPGVIAHYASKGLGSPARRSDQFKPLIIRALRHNTEALRRMVPFFALAQPLVSTIEAVLNSLEVITNMANLSILPVNK